MQNQEKQDTTTTPTDTTTTPTDTTTTPTDTTTTPTDTTTPPGYRADAGYRACVVVARRLHGLPRQHLCRVHHGQRWDSRALLEGGIIPKGPILRWPTILSGRSASPAGASLGTVSGLTDAHCGDGCNNSQISNPPPAAVNFPATFNAADCVNGVCPVADATVTQNGQTTTYQGLAVLKQDFFAYQLIGTPTTPISNSLTNAVIVDNAPSADPLLVFGGTGYNFGTPSGRIFAFED